MTAVRTKCAFAAVAPAAALWRRVKKVVMPNLSTIAFVIEGHGEGFLV